nr:MAG TPA: hypothetical protein [Caudoviricetes sp.]
MRNEEFLLLHLTFNAQHSVLPTAIIQHSTFNTQHCARRKHSTLNIQHSTFKNENSNPILHRAAPIHGKMAVERPAHGMPYHRVQSSADGKERAANAVLYQVSHQDRTRGHRHMRLSCCRHHAPSAQGAVCGEWGDKGCQRHTCARDRWHEIHNALERFFNFYVYNYFFYHSLVDDFFYLCCRS